MFVRSRSRGIFVVFFPSVPSKVVSLNMLKAGVAIQQSTMGEQTDASGGVLTVNKPTVDFFNPGVLGYAFGRGPVFSRAVRLVVFSLRFVRMIVLNPRVFDVKDFAGVLKATPW